VRAFTHPLGESGITFFAPPKLSQRLRGKFPKSLHGTPFLSPTSNTSLRRSLDQWFEAQSVHPIIVSEFEDTALLKVFGESGMGVFAAPTAIEKEVERQYNVRRIGRTDQVREAFYAISAERRLKHPAVVAISNAARDRLFK
jgi:LysR family transcriptional activator of nhaA